MKSTDLFDKAVEEFELRNYTCALALFESCERLKSGNPFRVAMYIAESALACNIPTHALETISRQTRSDEFALLQVARVRGNIFSRSGDWGKAMIEYDKIISLSPNDTLGYVIKASRKIFLGHPAEAIEMLDKALRLEGDLEEVHFNLALAYRCIRDYSLCIHHIDEALKIDPEYRQAIRLRADVERARIVTRTEKNSREDCSVE